MIDSQTRILNVPFVDLAAQYQSIASEINSAMTNVIQNTDFIMGKDVRAFEEEFAAYCNAQFAIGVDSGLSALALALRAYGIGPGDEVITSANTFIATALAISMAGARPVLVDVAPDTLTLDLERLEAAITPRTRAIMPVHLFGQPEDMDPIVEIGRRHGLTIIEDAAQAHGALYKGRRAGSLADSAGFSFYPGKNLGAYGDGGAVVTSDPAIEDKLQLLRNYGQRVKYHHLEKGYNHRLDTLQAAVLRVKLQYINGWNAARQRHAATYDQLLADTGVGLPPRADDVESVWHLYVIRVADRDALQAFLTERGISTGIHYPVPIHLQPAYSDLGYQEGDFPVAELDAKQILSLPMYAELSNEQIRHVADSIRDFAAFNDVQPATVEQRT